MRWTLRQTPEMPAGTAELRCDDCDLDAGSVELCLCQPQAGGGVLHLDPRDAGRPWGTPEFWQRPVAAEHEGRALRLRLDAFTTFHLGANRPYILNLRDAAGPRDGVPLLGIALRLPSAPPKGWRPPAPPAPPAPAVEPEPAEEPVVEEAPPALIADPEERPAAAPRRSPVVPITAALVALAIAGGAAWWYLGRPPAEAPATAEAPKPAAEPAPAPAPAPTPERTLAAARTALAAGPSATEARAAGEAHLAAGDLDGGFLLLRYAAERGDAAAAVAVGGLYDPATWSAGSSPLPAPNAEQAAAWYRRSAEAGDPEAQYRLGMVLRSGKTEAADGPEQAVAWLRKAAEQGHAKAKEALSQ